jgi:hypothetical protein
MDSRKEDAMNIQTLSDFLMWCTVINFSFLLLWSSILVAAPNFIYGIQRKFVSLTKEQFELFFYGFLAFYKVLAIFFNLVPFMVLKVLA